jgi:hypothetical protein
VWYGNPIIWVLPAAAWSRLGWPVVVAALKPMVLPLIVVGLAEWRRVAAAGAFVVLLALPAGGLWVDWIVAVHNSDLPVTYGWQSWFLLAVPGVMVLGALPRPALRLYAARLAPLRVRR